MIKLHVIVCIALPSNTMISPSLMSMATTYKDISVYIKIFVFAVTMVVTFCGITEIVF